LQAETIRALRHRIVEASRQIGWDVFTFHTLQNPDPFFDSTIDALRETWIKEGSLRRETVSKTRKQFSNDWDYSRIECRLVESLVLQTAELDWIDTIAPEGRFSPHFVGTALLSGMVWSGAASFSAAVETAMRLGREWDSNLQDFAEEELVLRRNSVTEESLGWTRFQTLRRLIEKGRSFPVTRPQCDRVHLNPVCRPFLFSALPKDRPQRVETPDQLRNALESLDIASWSGRRLPEVPGGVRGWLMSTLHPWARACRWSLSNFLLATPASVSLFLHHIAPIWRIPFVEVVETEGFQNRLRLSRMKVTGP